MAVCMSNDIEVNRRIWNALATLTWAGMNSYSSPKDFVRRPAAAGVLTRIDNSRFPLVTILASGVHGVLNQG